MTRTPLPGTTVRYRSAWLNLLALLAPLVMLLAACAPTKPLPPLSPGASLLQEVEGATVTIRPEAIPLTEAEIANPMRGSYKTQAASMDPPEWPFVDSYNRYSWRALEPERGRYDFSVLEHDLAKAKAHGGRLGIRILAANSYDGGVGVPDYLIDPVPGGGWFTYPSNGKSVYAPNWSSPAFLDRAIALVEALGSQYGRDPRLGFVDIGLFGDFGEWHTWQYPAWNAPMDQRSKRALIDAHIRAFPEASLDMPIDDPDSLAYALSISPRIGWRGDCLGRDHFDEVLQRGAWAIAENRWQTAPVITEFCNPPDLETAYRQVRQYHVSMIRNGNMPGLASYPTSQQGDFGDLNKQSGYRYLLDSLSLPRTIRPGDSFLATARWSNWGVAPVYEAWDVRLQFRNPADGTAVWEGMSSVELRSLLPTGNPRTGNNSPVEIAETFTLPQGVPHGEYDIALIVRDATGYYRPLALAMQGRTNDGSYRLGKVAVR